MNPPTAFTLARAYIALLRADLTPESIADAVRLNDLQANPALAHWLVTHARLSHPASSIQHL